MTDEVKYTYDAWGNVVSIRQDVNSEVGAGGSEDDLEVQFVWSEAVSRGGTGVYGIVRRTKTVLPNGAEVFHRYTSNGGKHDDSLSRVTDVKHGLVVAAVYEYNGLATLVGTELPGASVHAVQSHRAGGGHPPSYVPSENRSFQASRPRGPPGPPGREA